MIEATPGQMKGLGSCRHAGMHRQVVGEDVITILLPEQHTQQSAPWPCSAHLAASA